ncbi:MAG: AAA family ATPase [Thermoanaerobaculia bacterium]|nr:AAA family ATPase [Thermoanaerobaculia bacterium]
MAFDPGEVPELVQGILGDQAGPLAVAFAECIEAAHGANPNGWELTHPPSSAYLRLNAGAVLLVEVFRGQPGLRFAVDLAEDLEGSAGLEIGEPFETADSIALASFERSQLDGIWPKIRQSCLRAAKAVSAERKRVTWFKAHNQDAVDALAEISGIPLPAPAYLSPAEPAPLEKLYGQFLGEFGATPKGEHHAEIAAKSRAHATEIVEKLRASEAAGQDLTEGVLSGVLPHAGTAPNLARGAWVSIAPAVSSHIRGWFEGSGFRKPEDWPQVAKALWRLVSRALEEPADLSAAIEEFEASGWGKGFQAGMLSPFLSACRPDDFVIFNSKSRRTINYFTGSEYSAHLGTYPKANEKILQWTGERADLFRIDGLPSLRPHEAFDMFSHWLVAERKFFKGGGIADPPVNPDDGGEDEKDAVVFEARAFELIQLLSEQPTKETYNSKKEEFKSLVEVPLAKLFHAAVARIPERMRQALETKKNVLSRFLKNDYGKGGAWPWLWAAAYPKGGRRVDGAQLYIFVEAERLDMGFYIEPSSNEPRTRLTRNLEKFGPELRELLLSHWSAHPFDYGYRTESAGTAFGDDGGAWFDQVSKPSGPGGHPLRVGRTWKPEEVAGLGLAALADAVAATWSALFPLELMSIHEDPREEIRSYLQLESGIVAEPKPHPVPPLVPAGKTKSPLLSLSEIATRTRIPANQLGAWVRAIERKGQAILYGPPGTGKTFIARQLAEHLVGGGDGFVDLLQFHPSYAYEDFIQGLRPVSGDGERCGSR